MKKIPEGFFRQSNLILFLEYPGESAYNENRKALNQSRREREGYERGKKTGDFFGLHMTLVLFQYRAY